MSAPQLTTPHGHVDFYVHALGRRLRGPARARRGMLQEVRDGLDDAAGQLMADGVEPGEATCRAVHEFGPIGELAAGLQRELSVVQARRTAAWAAITFPTLWLAWDLMWQSGPDLGLAPAFVFVLARLSDILGLATAAICTVALATLELAGGRLARPERIARGIGLTALAGMVAVVSCSMAMTLINTRETSTVAHASAAHLLTVGVTALGVLAVLHSAVRCLRAGDRHLTA